MESGYIIVLYCNTVNVLQTHENSMFKVYPQLVLFMVSSQNLHTKGELCNERIL